MLLIELLCVLRLLALNACHRSPDDAKIKSKMLYASSRDALRRSLVGIATEVQGTALDEIAYEAGKCSSSDPTTPLSYQTLTSISAVFEKVKRLR